MKYQAGYTVKFDAGHRYTLRVRWDREGFGETDQDEWDRLHVEIDKLVAELRDRDLAKMLGPHHPSAFGICDFVMGRLKLTAPITEVHVRESDGPEASLFADATL